MIVIVKTNLHDRYNMPLDNKNQNIDSSKDGDAYQEEEVDCAFGVNQVMENNDISVILIGMI